MIVEDVVVVPSTLALLPAYSGLEDPMPDVRAATLAAVGWLVSSHPDEIALLTAPPRDRADGVPEPAAVRIGAHLLAEHGFAGAIGEGGKGLLVVANGSAKRSEKAPGHLDQRSLAFDAGVDAALRGGDPRAFADLDVELAADLWAFDAPALRRLAGLEGRFAAEVDYAGDPFGVQYWVARWTCES